MSLYSMLRKFLLLFCLILSHLAWAQVDRAPLFTEAFNGLPYYFYATIYKVDESFFTWGQSTKFAPEEVALLNQLTKIILLNHATTFKIQICGKEPCFDKFGKQVKFDLEEGQ